MKRRNEKLILAAVRSTAIVTSMFPSNVRERLYKEVDDKEKNRKQKGSLKAYLSESAGRASGESASKTAPLADLFAETTVLVCESEHPTVMYCRVLFSIVQPNLTIY